MDGTVGNKLSAWLSRLRDHAETDQGEAGIATPGRMGSAPLVDFVVAGAQKAGTTAVHRYLESHPQLVFGEQKELHFFDDEDLFGTGKTPDPVHYEKRFPARARDPDVVVGEVTPIYVYWPPSPGRIAAYNPDMRVIVLLRDPRDRAWSHYHMEFGRNWEDLPFPQAVAKELARVVRDGSPDRVRSYVTRGLYAQQLVRLWGFVPREQTLLVRHERLEDSPAEVVAEICDFLGVGPHQGVSGERVFVGDYPPMPSKVRDGLTAFFHEEIHALESLTGWDLEAWRT